MYVCIYIYIYIYIYTIPCTSQSRFRAPRSPGSETPKAGGAVLEPWAVRWPDQQGNPHVMQAAGLRCLKAPDCGCFSRPANPHISRYGAFPENSVTQESGVNRGQREHKGSFRGYPNRWVVRCSLDSWLLLSSLAVLVLWVISPLNRPPWIPTSTDSRKSVDKSGSTGPMPRARSRNNISHQI